MNKGKHGFSLVEMAVVLIIFGLVLASASSILTLFVNKGGAERTRKMMESNKNALFSIAASEQYPYLMDTATDDNTYPVNAGTTFMSYPQDAYGKDFLLILDSALGYTDAKDQLEYSPICGAKGTTTTVRICNASGAINTVCDETSEYTEVTDVAFVLVSGSVNKNIQTDLNTTTNAVTVYFQGQNGADDEPYGVSASQVPQQYDDIVDWVTLPELRVKAGCDPKKLDLIDSSMPVIQDGESYSFALFAKGGVPYVNATDSTLEEYEFTLDSITLDNDSTVDDLTAYNVEIKVMPSGLTLTRGGTYARQGNYLFFGNTTSAVTGLDSSYFRVRITISDENSTASSRTLYLKQQVN